LTRHLPGGLRVVDRRHPEGFIHLELTVGALVPDAMAPKMVTMGLICT